VDTEHRRKVWTAQELFRESPKQSRDIGIIQRAEC